MQKVLQNCLFLLLTLCVGTSLNAQWEQTNSPFGGSGRPQVFGDTVYFTDRNVLYFSTDDGEYWNELYRFNDTINIEYLSVSGNSIAFYSLRDWPYYNVFFSLDNGKTWDVNELPPAYEFNAPFLEIGNVLIWVGIWGNNNTQISYDFGNTWTEIYPRTLRGIALDQGVLFASDENKFLKSQDLGETWDTINTNSSSSLPTNAFFGVTTISGDTILNSAGAGLSSPLAVSFDKGLSWSTRFQTQNEISVAYDGKIRRYFHETNSGVIYTDDFGITWNPLSTPGFRHQGVTFTQNGTYLSGSHYTGIYRSLDNGASWEESHAGYHGTNFTLSNVEGNLYGAGGARLIKQKANSRHNWETVVNHVPQGVFGSYIPGGLIKVKDNYLFNIGSLLHYSQDSGKTWIASIGDCNIRPNSMHVLGDTCFVYNICSINGNSMLYSVDGGENFDEYFAFKDKFPSHSVAHFYKKGSDLYIISESDRIFISTDSGKNWRKKGDFLTVPIRESLSQCTDLEYAYLWDDEIVLFQYDLNWLSLYRCVTNDFGDTWTVDTLTEHPMLECGNSNLIMELDDRLIGLSDNGVFVSMDRGKTWSDFSSGLPIDKKCLSTAVDDNYIYLSVNDYGIWRRPISDLDQTILSGFAFYDENNNQIWDTEDFGFNNLTVYSTTSSALTTTGFDGGFYLFLSGSGERIVVQPPSSAWSVSPPSILVTDPTDTLEFAIGKIPFAYDGCTDLAFWSVLRPGFISNMSVSYKNVGSQPYPDATLTLHYDDDVIEFVSSDIPPSSFTLGTIQFDLGDLPLFSSGNIEIEFKAKLNSLDEVTCVRAELKSSGIDVNRANNIAEVCEPIVGSYDPNDKKANLEFIDINQLSDSSYIDYTIRFQNTGTYKADFVRILDTIDTDFDLTSFQFLSSSHSCEWRIKPGGVLDFFFDNIQLPDSTSDEPNSHGYVKYRILPKQDLPVFTNLENTAYIYFDYNEPIETNTTETVLGTVTIRPTIKPSQVDIYPNPSSQVINFNAIDLDGAVNVQVFDISGRLLFEKKQLSNKDKLRIQNLPSGTYKLLVYDGKRWAVGDFQVVH